MKTEWRLEQLSRKPEQFQQLSPDSYIQRKNIREISHKIEDGIEYASYECESRFISKDLYEEFMDAMDAPSQKQIMNNLEGKDSNTMVIMQAIADLYEAVVSSKV